MVTPLAKTLGCPVELVLPAPSRITAATHYTSETAGSSWSVCVWVSVVVAIMVAEGSLVASIPLEPQCGVWFGYGAAASIDVRALVASRLLPPLFSGVLLTGFVVYRHRYLAGSKLHFWTLCFAVVASGWSWIALLGTLNSCASKRLTSQNSVFLLQEFFWALTNGLLIWLSLLKARVLATTAPALVRIGELSGLLLTVHFALYWMLVLLGSAFSKITFYVDVIAAGTSCVFFGSLVVVLLLAANSAFAEASQNDVDDDSARRLTFSASWTRWTGIATATAGITHVSVWASAILSLTGSDDRLVVLLHWVETFDMLSNIIASACMSGIFCGDTKWQRASTNLRVVAGSITAQRRRHLERRLMSIAGASTGSALTIAYCMDGVAPADILREAESRFRCITWETLAARSDIILGGGPLDVIGPGGNDLYSLSEPCQLGDCDAFVSHSWHDDPVQKWEALRSWCDTFVRVQGYHPRLWIDKVCICQSEIETDLRCLPVFLAGCQKLLMISGPTYPARLWCSMEVLVCRAIIANDGDRCPPEMLLLGDAEQRKAQQQAWCTFDVAQCKCFNDGDKRRFLDLVNRYPGGSEGFNLFVRETIANILTLPEVTSSTHGYDFTERC